MARNSHHSQASNTENANNADPTQNPGSPYYVHPTENPSLVMVSSPLIGSNYHIWARSMRRALISKNKFKFLDGTITKPDAFHPLYGAWERCNNLIHSWLMHSLLPAIVRSVDLIEDASEVWKDLKERFSQGDLLRISELQQELYMFRQGHFSVTEFFTELKGLWEELENYRPIPKCACPVKCTCLAMRNTKTYREQDYSLRFLTGLGDQFAHVTS